MKRVYNKKNLLFDNPELIQKLRQSRTNYDYPVAKLSDFLGDWVVLETFVSGFDIKKGWSYLLLILTTLEDPDNPESDRSWKKYRVFCWSKGINNFLLGLRESGEEVTCLPLVLRFIGVPYTDKKTGALKTRYEIDCGLGDSSLIPPPALGPKN